MLSRTFKRSVQSSRPLLILFCHHLCPVMPITFKIVCNCTAHLARVRSAIMAAFVGGALGLGFIVQPFYFGKNGVGWVKPFTLNAIFTKLEVVGAFPMPTAGTGCAQHTVLAVFLL